MEELKKTKCACLIQGDIRNGTEEILKEMALYFDTVILSTWDDEPYIPDGRYHIVLSKKPENQGLIHRNYQRFGVARGLEYAEKLGCTHVLKWRTDMLPVRISQGELLKQSSHSIPTGFGARIVLPSFYCITKEVDCFSHITDYFAFSSIEMMKLLWGDEGFDYAKDVNMSEEICEAIHCDASIRSYYIPESELYALLKERLERKIGIKLNHQRILRDFCSLFDIEDLKICWFSSPERGFRAIIHPAWTKSSWKKVVTDFSYQKGYPWWKFFRDKAMRYLMLNQVRKQRKRYKKYVLRR